ncbi:hypothetical protein GLAREA_07781 [Glarea lozoyensis ATCC 20868]|uniref:Allergen Asp f 4 n=2 Tax=Glarea lozoyensis TaxID=101852 RepID=S3D284_GLAL2|nr:uncharacterized protein GLAREA_07781 [Glarea lozoyensis ATCC 20868]EHK96943.1 putative Allergen Asp f 4 [Glarea lozoyensis 74030]EPE32647.1 hypothetical protein GLAREA_07781 [Glarea lozoyensis ATCC 20868]
MVHFTATALFVAALSLSEVMAGPTHLHLHQRAHQKKDVDYSTIDYSKLDVDWDAAYAAGQASKASAAVAATPAASPAGAVFAAKVGTKVSSAVAAATSAVKSSGSSSGLLGGVVGCSNDRTSFGGLSTKAYAVGDHAINNVGIPYGANIIKVDSIEGYDFTNTFVNTQQVPITVNVWNKVGEDGQDLSGSTDAPKKTTLTFVLAPGASQIIAVQENSNIGFAQATTKLRADSGGFDTSFGEITFLAKGSGYNLSAIPNTAGNTYNMSISSVEAPQCTSDMNNNFWLTATQPIGTSDGSCYIAQSTAHLTTTMGGNI